MLVLFFKDSIITNTHISLFLFSEAVLKLYNFEETATVLFLNSSPVLNLFKIETGAVIRRRGTPNDGLYGEALPKRGTFLRLQVY